MEPQKDYSISGPPQEIQRQRQTTSPLQLQRVATITRWSPVWITTSPISRGFFCASITGTFRTCPSILWERACARTAVPRTITATPLRPDIHTALHQQPYSDLMPAFRGSLITAA